MYRKCEDQVYGTSQWSLIPLGCFHKAGRGFSLLTRLAAGGLFHPPIKDALFVFPSSHVEGKTKRWFQQKDTSPLNSGIAEGDVAKDANLSQQIWKSEKGRLGLFLFLFLLLLSYSVAMLGTVCDRHANN